MDRLISEQAVLDLIADYDLSMGQVVRGIHALPPVNPQEYILDKIRAEITALKSHHINDCYDDGFQDCRTNVLQIIDKYKGESEDKE